jgi:hypothetical protein
MLEMLMETLGTGESASINNGKLDRKPLRLALTVFGHAPLFAFLLTPIRTI